VISPASDDRARATFGEDRSGDGSALAHTYIAARARRRPAKFAAPSRSGNLTIRGGRGSQFFTVTTFTAPRFSAMLVAIVRSG
jgi:hypothetical protein